MTITPTNLSRAAGVSAAVAGLLFISVQLVHPDEDVASVTGTAWAVTHALTLLMSVLALIGVTGVYLRQVKEMGVLGLVGYLLFGAWCLVVMAFTFVEAFVLPQLADQSPRFVADTLALFTGGAVTGDLGLLKLAAPVSAATYMLGGALFGIALVRAAILARWAALLLAAGTVAALATAVLPHSLDRLAALPVGLALAGLGASLMREQRAGARHAARGLRGAQVDVAGAR